MRRSRRRTLILCLLLAFVGVARTARTADDRAPRLDTPIDSPIGATFQARGRDPGAPRSLVLWRWNGARFRRVARTRSRSNGRFDFGEQPISTSEAAFHVSARGVAPNTDHLLRIDQPVPAPVVLEAGVGSDEIVFVPARFEGEIRILDADTRQLLDRRPIEVSGARSFRFPLTELGSRIRPRALEIEQVLEDGRRSAPAFIKLSAPED